jgi:hypothetical protein
VSEHFTGKLTVAQFLRALRACRYSYKVLKLENKMFSLKRNYPCLLLASSMVLTTATALAQSPPAAASLSVLVRKTPVIAISKYNEAGYINFVMGYANAKASFLADSDPVAAKEWRDYFLTSSTADTVPPGVSAFAHKLVALGEAAATNPSIVLANITGEQVLEVVFKNYKQHLEATGTIPSRP